MNKKILKKFIDDILKKMNIHITTSREYIEFLIKNDNSLKTLLSLSARYQEFLDSIYEYVYKSKSQMLQDLFVLCELKFKRDGFFVEFGATNGINGSNTYLLEKEFGWSGVLAEPAKCWHNKLKNNRDCNIEKKCVWSESNSILSFNEVTSLKGYSTINMFSSNDYHSEKRKNGKLYDVESISLVDLLVKYNAPMIVDYLSIDTEGSEYDILKKFNFDKYKFRIITCEHNFNNLKREEIYNLLSEKGYKRIDDIFSGVDDFYVKLNI